MHHYEEASSIMLRHALSSGQVFLSNRVIVELQHAL